LERVGASQQRAAARCDRQDVAGQSVSTAIMIRREGHPVPEVAMAQDRPDPGHYRVDQPGPGPAPVGDGKTEGGHRVDRVDPDSYGQHFGAGLDTGQHRLGEMASTEDPCDSNTLGVHSDVTQMLQDRARPQQQCGPQPARTSSIGREASSFTSGAPRGQADG